MTPEQIERYVDAAAAALDLPIAADHRPGVLGYFALAAGMAELVGAHLLAVTDDPAESFVPIAPSNATPSSPSMALSVPSIAASTSPSAEPSGAPRGGPFA